MPPLTLNASLLTLAPRRRLAEATLTLRRSYERLASGRRINHVADDAAGLSIASSLDSDRRVLNQGVRNVNDGIGYTNVAGSALAELEAILNRVQEIAGQSANGVLSDSQRRPLQEEVTALADEYNRILAATQFNGQSVFSPGTLSIQAGYGPRAVLEVAIGGPSAEPEAGQEAPVGVQQLVSVSNSGTQGNGTSANPSMSGDGRYVAFASGASNLVAVDTNGFADVFVHDRQTGQTTRVSLSGGGAQGNGASQSPSISADGQYVAFNSTASTLVVGDTNGVGDVFVHDRQSGQTARVSVNSSGVQGNNASTNSTPSISADGRYVAFTSTASNLVAGDTNGVGDVFVHDRQTGQTTRVSVSGSGAEGNNTSSSSFASISADGRYVAFTSLASNLVAGDTNLNPDIFVHDRQTGQTTRVSVSSSGAQGSGLSSKPSISADGRYVAFTSLASNLVAGDTNGVGDVFVHDRQTGQTTRVSVSGSGAQGNSFGDSGSISADGRFVAFSSGASNLVAGDTNAVNDVFVHDRQSGHTTRLSVSNLGTQGNNHSLALTVSADGRFVAIGSTASNLVATDTNGFPDVFVAGTGVSLPQEPPPPALSPLVGVDVATQSEALTALDAVETYFDELSNVRSVIGAAMSRFASAAATLSDSVETITAAAGRIVDVDVAEEAARLIGVTILQQTGSAVLAQAYQALALVLELLAGDRPSLPTSRSG